MERRIRERIVGELERTTGGRVTLGRFILHPGTLTIEVGQLRIRGTEPAETPPLFETPRARLGLKVISFWGAEVDLASLEIDRPQVHLLVRRDGSTNLPAPKIPRRGGNPIETLLKLKIGRFAIADGLVLFDDRKIPLRVQGENLRVGLLYDWAGPRYKGKVEARPLRVAIPRLRTLELAATFDVVLERSRILVSNGRFSQDGVAVRADAEIRDFTSPVARVRFEGDANLARAAKLANWKWMTGGAGKFKGTAQFGKGLEPHTELDLSVSRASIRTDAVDLAGAGFFGHVAWNARVLAVDNIRVQVLGGEFRGTARIEDLERYRVGGSITQFTSRRVLGVLKNVPDKTAEAVRHWNAFAGGPIQLEGDFRRGVRSAEGRLTLRPAPEGAPVEGQVNGRYDGALTFADSFLVAGKTRVEFKGQPGSELAVRLSTSDPADFRHLLDLAKYGVAFPAGGSTSFDGTLTGNLDDPTAQGNVVIEKVAYKERELEHVSGGVRVSRSSLALRKAVWVQSGARVEVEGLLGLENWISSTKSPVSATLTLKDVESKELLGLIGARDTITAGRVTASAKVGGTIGDPHVDGKVQLMGGRIGGEPFERFEADLASVESRIEFRQARLVLPAGIVEFDGAFDHPPGDARKGKIRFEGKSSSLAFEKLALAGKSLPDTTAQLRTHLFGSVDLQADGVRLDDLRGHVAAANITYENKKVGNVIVALAHYRDRLNLRLDARLLETRVTGTGQVAFDQEYTGSANLETRVTSIAALRRWFGGPPKAGSLEFDGSADAKLEIAGPTARWEGWKGRLVIPALRIFPVGRTGDLPPERLTIRNDGPVELTLDRSVARLVRARMTGVATNLEAAGTFGFDERRPLDLQVKGGLDLRLVDEFSRDLTAGGSVAVNASIRGTLRRPALNGRLEMKGAALGLEDSPGGLSDVDALIVFNDREANIQKLTAEAGGGRLEASGFVEFLEDEYAFRLEAKAKQIRVRYPEGVSTSSDANLTWSGTTKNSLLSGRVTMLRASFNPRTDLSSIFAKSAEPVRTPSSRTGIAAGVQFDVLVDSAPNLTLESALAQDIQAEASLRLKGTPFNPVLLGRIAITQGEVSFFGTRYNINQGTIDFLNPLKLEPVLNIDLETRVRGIDVILTLSGPVNKVSITHRADPPLQFSEVIALLATGRTPTSNPTLAARSEQQTQSLTQLGATALVGQAIATPVTNRLQRFFGVSRLKFDPNLTGVDNRPQARVTIEQQVTRNITFTYITDVQRTNQQIVRMEWSVNKEYSVLVVREDNGILGMDILYRKGFR
ncbi:MAG: translocation/assembly module TamB domain-containing protein [Bryobacteraceae bacterium]